MEFPEFQSLPSCPCGWEWLGRAWIPNSISLPSGIRMINAPVSFSSHGWRGPAASKELPWSFPADTEVQKQIFERCLGDHWISQGRRSPRRNQSHPWKLGKNQGKCSNNGQVSFFEQNNLMQGIIFIPNWNLSPFATKPFTFLPQIHLNKV